MRAVLGLLLALAGCGAASDVADYGNGGFGLATRAASAARDGVERAEAYCAAKQRVMLPERSLIGAQDYQLAFRCLAPGDPALRQGGG